MTIVFSPVLFREASHSFRYGILIKRWFKYIYFLFCIRGRFETSYQLLDFTRKYIPSDQFNLYLTVEPMQGLMAHIFDFDFNDGCWMRRDVNNRWFSAAQDPDYVGILFLSAVPFICLSGSVSKK